MKVISLIGARPQFIKEAVLHEQFNKAGIKEVLVNSGQHYDMNMSDVFFKTLNIKEPDYNLKVGSGKHGEMTGKIMIEFERVVEKEMPDKILVYGDTNTTLAGAIVGSKMKIPVAHVEAGIRMLPRDMPEEINRVLTDRVSSYCFSPSALAVENLKNEGITENVYFVGDIMYDLYKKMKSQFSYDAFEQLKLQQEKYIVFTLHRDYNVDHSEKLRRILVQVNSINKDVPVVFSVHPRTKKKIKEFNLEPLLENLILTEPLDYLNIMGLISKCWKVITDSGGLQKESYFAGKSSVVLMPDTGWLELIERNINFLADGDNLLKKTFNNSNVHMEDYIYGKGNAGNLIVEHLCN